MMWIFIYLFGTIRDGGDKGRDLAQLCPGLLQALVHLGQEGFDTIVDLVRAKVELSGNALCFLGEAHCRGDVVVEVFKVVVVRMGPDTWTDMVLRGQEGVRRGRGAHRCGCGESGRSM